MGYAFISYSTKNQEFANSFRNLFNQQNIHTWMAPGDIPPGETYTSIINNAIKNASCFIILLSESAQNSQWVPKETERAVNYGKSIFTIKLDDVPMNDSFEIMLSSSQAVAVRRINKDDENIQKLLTAVKTYTGETKEDKCTLSKVQGIQKNDTDINNDCNATVKHQESHRKNSDQEIGNGLLPYYVIINSISTAICIFCAFLYTKTYNSMYLTFSIICGLTAVLGLILAIVTFVNRNNNKPSKKNKKR